MNAISCSSLSVVTNSGHSILADIELDISAGERVCLLGPSGAGKTTLLRTLAGLQKHQGSLELADKALAKYSTKELASTRGFLPQGVSHHSELPAEEVLRLGGLSRAGRHKNIRQVADQCGISSMLDRPFRYLSGGEKRLVLLAQVFVQDPSILLLDEPTAGLDPKRAHDVLTLLGQEHLEAKTIIVATHNVAWAKNFAEKIIGLKDGQISFVDTVANALPKVNDLYGMDGTLPW